MGYERKDIQILGGGFNLLPPGDKVPRTDYLLAQNWRVDRVGKLVSRFGYGQKFSIAGAGIAHSAAVYGGVNGDYYVGANDSFTTPTGKVYYNFSPAAIATGFDGNRIGFAAMNGFMWVMNRGKQGRHSAAAGFETWNITAPSSSCSAAAAATPAVAGSVTYTYALQGSSDYIHYLTIAGVTYSIAENGYSAPQIPLVLSLMAAVDANCSVTYPGSGQDVTITPIIPNTLFAITGSDGNAPASLATGGVTSLPSGTYQYYVTFANADESLESNGGPASASVTVTASAVTLTNVPVSADSRVTKRNIYATGGTLGQPYLVGTIADNSTTTITISLPDLEATNGGVVMPTNHDAPPAASGVVGPHFSRLFAFGTVAHVNRLFYTDPILPQYWPGSGDQIGNWVDVGKEGEAIVWCTIHTNLLVIYKERSIWVLIGDPSNGQLVCVTEEIGLAGQFAVTEAGAQDYFVGSNGLYRFDMDRVHPAGGAIAPVFNASSYGGANAAPGSVLTGAAFNSTSSYPYAVALGYALGKLYVAYAEQSLIGTTYCLLVYHEESERWFYHRNAVLGATGFFGWVFDGVQMVGLTGSAGAAAQGLNVDDFRGFFTQDAGPVAIECVYKSHYEDCGLPDNEKIWLEVVIDFELAGADTATVTYGVDNGVANVVLGTLTAAITRQQKSFTLGADGVAGKNFAVQIDCVANSAVVLHNVFLYYYPEARLATTASTIPVDLGSPKVKQCKELMLDIDAGAGAVTAKVSSDLPGNTIALRQTVAVAAAGRGVRKFPFATTEGFLWKVALTGGPFRLYSARLLMRPIGVYVEAYESAAGFVWDSMEQSFDDGITHIQRQVLIAIAALPIKRSRELSIEIETFGGDVTVTWLSDLPGDAMASRYTATINTGTAGRRFVRLTIAAGTTAPVEGRMFRLQLSGSAKFILYGAAVELLAVGVYLEASDAAGGAVYDSREIDAGTPQVKEARELELDIETTGNVTAQLLGDLASTVTKTVATTGRQKVLIPLTVNAGTDAFFEARLLRLLLSGSSAVRLYGARIQVRPFGCYLTADETGNGALWDSTAIDLGGAAVKQLREVELDMQATAACTVTVYTDLPGNAMASRAVRTVTAATRTKLRVVLPQGGVPDNYVFGRLVRVTVATAGTLKLFGARIHARPVGTYIEAAEASGGAVWDSSATDLGSPMVKTFDEIRFEMDSDAGCTLTVYTDLPGENYAARGTYTLTSGATGRHYVTVPLPENVEGRSVRLQVASASGFRLYKAQVRAGRVGRYLAGVTASGGTDALRTLEYDFRTERVKLLKRIEVDVRADSTVTAAIATDQTGAIATAFTNAIEAGGRAVYSITMPPGVRGRLLRITLTGGPARVYRVRVWTRPVNEPGASWTWQDYPCEESDVLPSWSDLAVEPTPDQFAWAELPVAPTPAEWAWVPLPVNPTEAQWFWARVLAVEETPDRWEFVDVPFEVVG